MTQNRSKQGGKLYLIMMIVVVAITLLGSLTTKLPLPDFGMTGDIAISEAIFLVPVLVILFMDHFEPLRGMKLRLIGMPTILWTMLLSLLLLPVMALLNLLTQFLVPNAAAAMLGASTSLPLWVSLLYFAVLPPVVEEFIFRGVLFQYFRPCGLWKTALLTGLMFGLAHLNLNQFLYAFAIGIFWTMLDEATGSVFSSMISHGIVNGLNVILMYIAVGNLPENLVGEVNQVRADVSSIVYLVVLAVIAGACVILAVMVIRHLAKVRGNEQKFRDALHGRDRLRGKDGRTFSPELLISLVIPIVFIGINIAMQ